MEERNVGTIREKNRLKKGLTNTEGLTSYRALRETRVSLQNIRLYSPICGPRWRLSDTMIQTDNGINNSVSKLCISRDL